jgi:hypothetical protein
MRVIFQEVLLENVVKGKSRYTIAHVTYTVNGSNKTYRAMSFANPEVFGAVQKFTQGQELEVTITKNDAGYDNWAKVVVASQDAPVAATAASGAPSSGKVLGNQYETRDERNTRQLHIVRQSSISNAVNILTPGSKAALDVDKVLEVAQQLVDFVYSDNTEDLMASGDPNIKDVPY